MYSTPFTPAKNALLREIAFFDEKRPAMSGRRKLTLRRAINHAVDQTRYHLPVKPLPQLKDGIYPVTGSGVLAVIKDPPHPNAAKVFVNWLLSKEGQETYQNAIGEPTRRLDVEVPKEPFAVRPAREFMSVEQYHRLESHTEEKQDTVRKPAIAAAARLIK